MMAYYFGRQEYPAQPIAEQHTHAHEFHNHAEAQTHALALSKEYKMPILMHAAGKKEYYYCHSPNKMRQLCALERKVIS